VCDVAFGIVVVNDRSPRVDGAALWHKGKLIGAMAPLRASHVRSIRTNLGLSRIRNLALLNSKPRGRAVVAVHVDDVAPNGYTLDRATIRGRKTGRRVRFRSRVKPGRLHVEPPVLRLTSGST
jgi:hypothetical protein